MDANFTHFTELLARREGICLFHPGRCIHPLSQSDKDEKEAHYTKAETAAGINQNKKEALKIQENLVAVEDAHSRHPRCAYFSELEQMNAYTLRLVQKLKDHPPCRGGRCHRNDNRHLF